MQNKINNISVSLYRPVYCNKHYTHPIFLFSIAIAGFNALRLSGEIHNDKRPYAWPGVWCRLRHWPILSDML